MKILFKQFTGAAIAATALLATSQSSYGQLTLSGSGSDGDGSFSGKVIFNLMGDVLQIQLENTTVFNGQWQAGQLISGLSFGITGGGSPTLFSGAGNTFDPTATGTQGYTVSSDTAITGGSKGEWELSPSGSGSTFSLDPNDLSYGQPNYLIIGADSDGGFSGAGTYNVGSSVVNHAPIVLGSATFYVTVQGLTSLSQINDVDINFGTAQGEGSTGDIGGGGGSTPVPEPASIISGALMLIPLSIGVIRVYSKRLQSV